MRIQGLHHLNRKARIPGAQGCRERAVGLEMLSAIKGHQSRQRSTPCPRITGSEMRLGDDLLRCNRQCIGKSQVQRARRGHTTGLITTRAAGRARDPEPRLAHFRHQRRRPAVMRLRIGPLRPHEGHIAAHQPKAGVVVLAARHARAGRFRASEITCPHARFNLGKPPHVIRV